MSTTQNEVRFNAGETLVLSDFHDMQRFLKSMVFDQFIGASPRINLYDSGFPSTVEAFLLCPHVGSGYPAPGAGTRQITNNEGMVYQWVSSGAPNGTSCNLLGYQLATNELLSTLGANASGNPRIDALCIKLAYDDSQDQQTRDFEDATTHALSSATMYKKRRTTLVSQVVAGTPAASPDYPTIPAGYVVLSYVYVPNGYATTFTYDHVWDARLPMRIGTAKVTAIGAIKKDFTLDGDWYSLSDVGGAGSYKCWFPFPRGAECRILSVQPMANAIGQISLRRLPMSNPSTPSASNICAQGVSIPAVTLPYTLFAPYGGLVTPPVWGNGSSCGAYSYQSSFTGTGSKDTALVAEIPGTGAGSVKISGFEWIFAY